jgi:hypothetical protein
VAAAIYLGTAVDRTDDGTRGRLIDIEGQSADFLAGGVVQAVGLLALAVVLVYLYRVTRHRASIPRVALVVAVAGPVLGAIAGVLSQVVVLDVAKDFVASGPQTEERADDVVKTGSVQAVAGLGIASNLALGFGVILISLNAMRAGLLSRFMGILGIIIGVLSAIQFGVGPVLQLFWLGALAALFLGYWPGGRGPAWESGEAAPWPSGMEQRMARARREQGESGDEAESEAGAERGTESSEGERRDPVDESAEMTPHPTSKKRKRKRRR